MFVELHMLQNFVPSNLNRDDNNYPKTTDFGGARRARISSQCIKRAIRCSDAFETFMRPDGESDAERLHSIRTKRMMDLLKPRLLKAGKPEAEADVAIRAFTTVYAGLEEEEGNALSSVLVFVGQDDIAAMTGAILENWNDILAAVPEKDGKRSYSKDTLKKAKALKDTLKSIHRTLNGRTEAPAIALFGRMLADNPELAQEAACQVANAISTHAVETEYDYFTAMDDLRAEPGAGMIQITGFNSACYYRYACLDWDQLRRNLGEQGLAEDNAALSTRTVDAFLRAWIETVPTGMKNRFAPNNMPDFVLAVVRTSGPGWSLANAFEKPVKPSNTTGWLEPSVRALDEYWNCLYTAYADDDGKAKEVKSVHFFALKPELAGAAKNLNAQLEHRSKSLKAWRAAVVEALTA